MKYVVYIIYKVALGNEYKLNPVFTFQMLLALFELYHVMIIGIAVRLLTGFHILETGTGSLVSLIGFACMCLLNYFYFIRGKHVFRIHEYYSKKKSKGWKGISLIFLYMLFLVILLYAESYIYTRNYFPILD